MMATIRRLLGIREVDFTSSTAVDHDLELRASETEQHLKRERHHLNQTVQRVESGVRVKQKILMTMTNAMRMMGEDGD